ncbi:flavoprotein hydroxylase [Raineyella antarctica]|uniref:Flavoprotein hydroxylase n=1 Tax=Raineyella antarctica TaxID=1577474 RepID=A0A1G6ID60_9ACTN|nr:bifunctional 3-(3-hydroxy-phenyl)propionate/3-hydroxycinnamic acid hydroxylase [Raineyella antarctica]SDC04303.1 flavoprotein hydroxylase [Raineyella antarctica]
MNDTMYDAVIVGAGPVGLSLGRMLGLNGHQVLILDRWPQPYPLPRAVHFDDEIGRIFQSMELTDQIKAVSEGVPDFYEWRNAEGETLVRIDWSGTGPCGWPTASFFSQPQVEALLADAVEAMDNVTLMRAAEAVGIEERDDSVRVTLHSTQIGQTTVDARFVVGCDGAKSFVREHLGTTMHDEGFFFDWLIVDVMPKDDVEWSPQNWQSCDPARPTTLVSGGPGRRRWEFMRLPGETRAQMNTPEKAWQLLEAWGRTPENTELERHALYTFSARWAEKWNSGRLAIAGDAAHQMPPFAGQGMCSGLRDAANLAWKLDRVLRGESTQELLDTYTSERKAHLQHAIAMSVELGRVICVLDVEIAAERDARMLAGGADPAKVLPISALPVLGEGVCAEDLGIPDLRGTLAPQFPVDRDSRTDLLDDITGPGALLLVPGTMPAADQHDPALLDQLVRLEVQPLAIAVTGSADLQDPTGAWTDWFTQNRVAAVLIRPDHYIFGAVTDIAELSQLVDEYQDRIAASTSSLEAVRAASALA